MLIFSVCNSVSIVKYRLKNFFVLFQGLTAAGNGTAKRRRGKNSRRGFSLHNDTTDYQYGTRDRFIIFFQTKAKKRKGKEWKETNYGKFHTLRQSNRYPGERKKKEASLSSFR